MKVQINKELRFQQNYFEISTLKLGSWKFALINIDVYNRNQIDDLK